LAGEGEGEKPIHNSHEKAKELRTQQGTTEFSLLVAPLILRDGAFRRSRRHGLVMDEMTNEQLVAGLKRSQTLICCDASEFRSGEVHPLLQSSQVFSSKPFN